MSKDVDCSIVTNELTLFVLILTGFHRYPVPCYLAVLDLLMTDILPTICHSASIWLTLMLAVQRYIYVCHPGKARIWCTIPRVTAGTVVIYSVAGLYNLPRLFERKFHSGYFPWECAMVNQCIGVFQEWAVGYYLPVFYWYFIYSILLIIFSKNILIFKKKFFEKFLKMFWKIVLKIYFKCLYIRFIYSLYS